MTKNPKYYDSLFCWSPRPQGGLKKGMQCLFRIKTQEKIDFFQKQSMPGMSETQIFGKIAKLESHFVQHIFCLILFKLHTNRPRFYPFSKAQNLIQLKSCFVHYFFCLALLKSRTFLARSSLFHPKNELD